MPTIYTLSVIVPVYNSASTLTACLEALLEQDFNPFELIIVDDGSTDSTLKVAKSFTSRGIKVISTSHQGAAVARNRGVMEAQGNIILFTDADCTPVPNWVSMMAAGLIAGIEKGQLENVRVVGAKGVYATKQKGLVARFVQLEFEYRYIRLAKQPYLEFVDTYSAAYQRKALLGCGGFDPSFPGAIVEDAELAWRLASQGYRMVFLPAAQVGHTHVSTISAYFRRKFRIGYWRVAVYGRHPERLANDSHTSRAAKIQMALISAGICIGLLNLSLKLVGAKKASAIAKNLTVWLAFLFYASASPFLIHSWKIDRVATGAALYLIPVRALAFSFGAIGGW
ncbi:glycosyltransferase [Candidatus Chlorohelix sp.]|uniref:glycosyltransferase n=1 Tax=Candidatus Chlorohelix sp. TaxID=3139201 RepID=UPI0030352458